MQNTVERKCQKNWETVWWSTAIYIKTALRLTDVHVQRTPCVEPWFLWLTRLDYGMSSGGQLSFHQQTQVAQRDMFQSWPYTRGAFVQIVLLQPVWSSKMRKWIPETEHTLTFFSMKPALQSVRQIVAGETSTPEDTVSISLSSSKYRSGVFWMAPSRNCNNTIYWHTDCTINDLPQHRHLEDAYYLCDSP